MPFQTDESTWSSSTARLQLGWSRRQAAALAFERHKAHQVFCNVRDRITASSFRLFSFVLPLTRFQNFSSSKKQKTACLVPESVHPFSVLPGVHV